MKKSKIKIIFLSSIIPFTCSGVGITLYFTIVHKNDNDLQKINLNKQSFDYLAKVEYMNKITNQEATIIKNDIKISLDNKLNQLMLFKNIDYQINNLDTMKANDDLNDFLEKILVASISNSKKATGSFIIKLNVQENIINRFFEPIEINNNQINGLTKDQANSIINNILIKVQTILTQGQFNEKDIDYEIKNLNLIKEKAKFSDYNKRIKVIGKSKKLIGEFLINFKITYIN